MRNVLRLATLSVTACAMLAGASIAGASAPAAGTTVHNSAVAGTLVAVRHTDSSVQSGVASPIRGERAIPRNRSALAPATAAPRAAGSAVLGVSNPLLANFNGVSSRDSEVTNFGQEFEPPDQGLCVGNGFVMEMVNSAYTIYRPDGSVVTGPFNINGPFDEGLREFTSDPRCHYDAATNTWFASILFLSGNGVGNKSHIDLAVNTTGDPTKLWTDYQIDTTDPGGPGCPCFGDQPTLGIDPFNVYITTNEFSILGPQFNGAQVYAISKHDLVSGKPTVHFVHFTNLNLGGMVASSIQPALTTGNPPAEYFLNSLDPNGTFDQRLGVWAMTNRSRVSTGGIPTLSSVVINSEAYGLPPAAEQKGSSSLLDSGDDRMQQTQYINGGIWGELTTALTIPGDSQERAGGAWFRVVPRLDGDVLSDAMVSRQGYVAVRGAYFIYPALQMAPNGTAAVVGTLSGASYFPSAAYAVMAPGSTSFGPVTIAAPGTTSYDPNATRWGDYSWAVISPNGRSIWLATEYVPPKSSQTTDGATDWGTRVLDVSAG